MKVIPETCRTHYIWYLKNKKIYIQCIYIWGENTNEFDSFNNIYANLDGKRNCYLNIFKTITTKFEPRSWRGVFDTTLCDKVCQWLATGWWFSPGTPVFSINKTERHDISEILLEVELNTIPPKPSNNEPVWW